MGGWLTLRFHVPAGHKCAPRVPRVWRALCKPAFEGLLRDRAGKFSPSCPPQWAEPCRKRDTRASWNGGRSPERFLSQASSPAYRPQAGLEVFYDRPTAGQDIETTGAICYTLRQQGYSITPELLRKWVERGKLTARKGKSGVNEYQISAVVSAYNGVHGYT